MRFLKNIYWGLILFSGCAYLSPAVENFNFVSVQEETQIGAQMAATVSKQMKLIEGPSTDRVRAIGSRLISQLPSQSFAYHFYVADDKTPNAFTIPGGTIYVHTGLLSFVDDENQLAGVIAHEIGHAWARHPARSISRQYGLDYLSGLLFPENQQKVKALALNLASTGFLMHYSRADELQADTIGFDLLKRAGFQSDGLLRFLKKIQTLEKSGSSLSFFASHPPTPERVARLEAMQKSGTSAAALGAR